MRRFLFFIFAVSPLILNGCSGAKDKLGLTKKAPDEFAVVRRAPLSMPPDYALRPPVPGADRPQEQSTEETARNTLFGEPDKIIEHSGLTNSENTLLSKAGTHIADPQIREKIKAEEEIIAEDNRPIGKKLFGIGSSDSGDVLDAKEEFKRIRAENDNADKDTTAE